MKLSKRNVFVGIGSVVLLMLFTNPTRRYYIDTKLEDTHIVETIAESICKQTTRNSSNYSASFECERRINENQSATEQFINNNYKRRNFFILSMHRLDIPQSESGGSSLSVRTGIVYEDIGVLGIFINSGIVSLLGLMIVFTAIAVLIVRFKSMLTRLWSE
ncbi:DUF4359 domain-containing protein [Pseudanabaena galeata UHCC 0370]|uniref:DUF4359 domain-containing protein n=1 Tax=Pseudanabaena galeata UHCC 0370 TaxID=3110310 RepID=A0ABU5TFP1_9CYAN|nr:DUF4359 domain-containing protein [Pseudanabaena galeata]MEA5476959.1 DUF4359 domain-containing protein [Pseudanabaena galeata UHCC 0370]